MLEPNAKENCKDIFTVAKWGNTACNKFWRILYKGPIWLPVGQAKTAVECGWNMTATCMHYTLHMSCICSSSWTEFPQSPILLRKRLVPLQVFANKKIGNCSMYDPKCIWCNMWCYLAACRGFFVCACVCSTCVFTWSGGREHTYT